MGWKHKPYAVTVTCRTVRMRTMLPIRQEIVLHEAIFVHFLAKRPEIWQAHCLHEINVAISGVGGLPAQTALACYGKATSKRA